LPSQTPRLALIAALCLCRTVIGRDIWIDTDPAIGSPIREVDDGFALVLAFRSPELRIIGISSTYGNAPLYATDRIARKLVTRFGGDAGLTSANVYRGAKSSSDLGTETDATRALASTLRTRRHVTYVALGPLTNVATLLLRQPKLAARIDEIVFAGGKSPEATLEFGPLRIHDANVIKDPAAARIVLQSKIPLWLVPPESSARLLFNSRDLREIRTGGAAGDYLYRNSRLWLWFWTHIARQDGGPLFDALTIAALRPQLCQWQTRYAQIDKLGDLIAKQRPAIGRRIKFCSNITRATKPFVLRRLRASR
jgi:pyrimidine-specific ribonucleoside hydrolase